MGFYIQVYNTTMKETVTLDKMDFDSIQEAKNYRDMLRRDFSQQGCIEVRAFLELFPEPKEEDEEEDIYDDTPLLVREEEEEE